MTRTLSALCILVFVIAITPALAHEVLTHQKIGNVAVGYLQSTGRPMLPNLQQLLLIGAVQEDNDPIPAAPCVTGVLSFLFKCPVLGRYFFHFSPALSDIALFQTVLAAANCSSIQWGLDPTVAACTASVSGPGVNIVELASNNHTWGILDADNIVAGNRNLPSQQSIIDLGYLLHLLEDLGSPPHTRNSMHPCLGALIYCEPFEVDNNGRTPSMPSGTPIISTVGFTTPQHFFTALETYTAQNYYSTDSVFAPILSGPCSSATPCPEDNHYFYGACSDPSQPITQASKQAGTCANGLRKVAHKGPLYWACACSINVGLNQGSSCSSLPVVNSVCNTSASIDSTIAMEQFNELGPVIVQVVASFIEFYAPALSVQTLGNGTVSSNPGTIANCTNCSWLFVQGTKVTLTAIPTANTPFIGWSGSGDCTGATLNITLTMLTDMNCVATFGPGPPLASGQVFVSPDVSICDYVLQPPPAPLVSPPCIIAQQSFTPTAFSLSVQAGGASSQTQYGGSTLSVSSSTATANNVNRSDAVGGMSSSYVLTSTTLTPGTSVSLTAVINRSGVLSVQSAQANPQGQDVTAQDVFSIYLVSNNVVATSQLDQAERVLGLGTTFTPATDNSLADSNVFTFGLAGNNPILLSAPTIIDTSARQSNAVANLGSFTVNFQIPVGQPFSFGVTQHANTSGGNYGNAIANCTIPQPQFTLPPNVTLQPF